MKNDFIIKKLEEHLEEVEKTISEKFIHFLNSFTFFISDLFDKIFCNKNERKFCTKLELIKAIKGDNQINCLCFLKDGRLVSCYYNGIVIYNKQNYQSELRIQTGSVFSVCGLLNGNLASGGDDKLIKIWKIKGSYYELNHTLKGHNNWVNKVIELEDGRLCSCSDDETIRIWNNKSNYQCIQTLTKHGEIKSIVEINNYIVSSGDNRNMHVVIWDKHTYKLLKTIENVYCYSRNGLAKLRDNKVILGGLGEIFILDILSFQFKYFENRRTGEICSLCVLRDGRVLIGNREGLITCFDQITNQITFTKEGDHSSITCIIEDENNQIFSSSHNHIIYLYEKLF